MTYSTRKDAEQTTIFGFAAEAAHRCLWVKCVSAPWTGSVASDLTQDRRETLRAADHLAKQATRENSSHSLKDKKRTIITVLKKKIEQAEFVWQGERSPRAAAKKKEEAEEAGR